MGCDKFVDVPLPNSQLSTASTFADNDKAGSAIRGIYASTQNAFGPGPFSGTMSSTAGMTADELIRTSYNADQEAAFLNNLAPMTAIIDGSLWGNFYNYIYQCNNAIVNLEKSAGVTPERKVMLLSESKFLRALSYFYLVNLYGKVPLLTGTDYKINALIPETDTAAIWQLIESDLRYAVANGGSVAYTKTGTRNRAGSNAATALLARVLLYRKNWAEAEIMSTTLINSGLYKLDTLGGIMLTTSAEPIFYLNNAGTNLYALEGTSIHGTALQYRLSPTLLASFEAGDQRLVKWTRPSADGKLGLGKYKIMTGSGTSGKEEATVLLRIAEQYLIRAEARAKRDNLPGAIADLDEVRKRAGISLIANTLPNITQTALVDTILHERYVELFGEFGHRWLDVKRMGKADQIFGANKPGWETTDALYPIPGKEREKNPNLGQNDGY
ncbi:RagB/SusD family nutrient uptake outer membrane protein [Chitinophaga sedimenti]|uniref:RagB/SusD family nutrient uptake outer membrane protein n=1 Tax=Chitinophaga sedimenti TaxID=2033606 RepID=UPI002002AEDD|nr:RagB/SusD family nutrient uptake outer membrane protein [Chitinophaga sedimenti]MCK7556820.1 RagB/SusD family nutrient uptake outer membrane protein [Chitinophaga sedimenti]